MSGLTDLQSSSLYFRSNYYFDIFKVILKWYIKLFAAFCMLIGFTIVVGFLLYIWLEDPETNMTGIGSCGSYNCVDKYM